MEHLVIGNKLDVVEEGVSRDGFVVDDDDSMELFKSRSIGNEDQWKGRVSSLAPPPLIRNGNRKPQFAEFVSPNEKSEDVPLNYKEKYGKEISESELAELEMVKERLSKLLLGEDMSGSGNGVQTALAISNAVTNLSASVFGQLWRLEPLPQIKKSMWRREMECILCVTDYIVVLSPSWHVYPDGSKVEIMSSRPRSDLAANLPALRKLDSMLLEILDCFTDTEFWYVEKGLANTDADDDVSSLSSKTLQSQEEKWWLPVVQVPPCGLSNGTRKMLQNKRECAKQILKAVTAINNMTLADMEVPEFYYDSIPKHAKDCLGEKMYRYISSHRFSAERLVAALGITSDHQALELANQVEAAIFAFNRRSHLKDLRRINNSSKHSWELVKDLTVDAPKTELLCGRAESLLLCLKQQFPGLPQTTLDSIKIQHNRDIGKSILESYSRVLESLAFNISGRIDDVLLADDMASKSSNYHGKNTSVPAPNTDNNKSMVKKTTLMSHIPSLQTSTYGNFEI